MNAGWPAPACNASSGGSKQASIQGGPHRHGKKLEFQLAEAVRRGWPAPQAIGSRQTSSAPVRAAAASKLRPARRICPPATSGRKPHLKQRVRCSHWPYPGAVFAVGQRSPLLSEARPPPRPAPADVCNDRRMCWQHGQSTPLTRRHATAVAEIAMLLKWFAPDGCRSRKLITCGTRE